MTDDPSFLRAGARGITGVRMGQRNDCCGDLQSGQSSGAKVPSETGEAAMSARRRVGSAGDHRTNEQNLPLCFTLVTQGSFKSSLILSDPPMYSSSTYETSSPSSDLVATDHPAVDTRTGTRGHDSASGFSVGLIPQLIDVLRILTEGQDLLSRKIRSALLEESSHPFSIVEQDERLQVSRRTTNSRLWHHSCGDFSYCYVEGRSVRRRYNPSKYFGHSLSLPIRMSRSAKPTPHLRASQTSRRSRSLLTEARADRAGRSSFRWANGSVRAVGLSAR